MVLIENGEAMKEDLKQQPCMIERLYGMLFGKGSTLILTLSSAALVTDLYMDRAGFKGQNVKDKIPKLLELLDNCDLENLLEFFEIGAA